MNSQVTNKTGGGPNHLDMPPSTWSQLTNNYPSGGVSGIRWKFIDCPITTLLQIRAHGGSSQYWPSVTIENATQGTTNVEFSDDQGATWHGSSRNTNKFFVMDGTLAQAKVWVRVTGEGGEKVVVKGVELASGVVTKAGNNF